MWESTILFTAGMMLWGLLLAGILWAGTREEDGSLCPYQHRVTQWCSVVILRNDAPEPLLVTIGAVSRRVEAGGSESFRYEWGAWRTIELHSEAPLDYRIEYGQR